MQIIVFFSSILLTFAITGGLAFYAWRQHSVPGARTFALMAFNECLLALAEMLFMLSAGKTQAEFWWKTRFFFSATIPVLWLLFALEYNGHKEWLPRRVIAVAFVIPVLTQLILWSNSLHGLWVKQEVGFTQSGSFWLAVTSDRIPGLWFLLHSFYSFFLLLVGIVVILITAWGTQRLHKGQALLLTSGALIVLATALIPIFNPIPQVRFNPFILGIGASALLCALAIFFFKFLRRSPIAGTARTITHLEVEEKRQFLLFLLIFGVMIAGIAAVVYFSYQTYECQFRAKTESELASIATLKVNELGAWRTERLADGEILQKNLLLSALIQRYFENPADTVTKTKIQGWLEVYAANAPYDRVSLLDEGGVERISAHSSPELVAAHLAQQAATVLTAGQVTFLDFHRDMPDGPIHLAVLSPIYSAPDHHPLGIIVLQIDPNLYLYPLIQQWPVPSTTAETLLIRREGSEAVFLNEIRFHANTALTLRIPLEKTQILAVKAALGQTGEVEGVDYRGVPSIGYIHAVPDSPWSLVARMDTAEIYAPLRERLLQTILIFSALILAAGTGLVLIWRQQRLRFFQARYEAGESLRESEERFRMVADYTYDWEYWRAPDGRILYMSPSCERISGYRAEEFIENPDLLNTIVVPEDRQIYAQHLVRGLPDDPQEDMHQVDIRILRWDGEVRWIAHTCLTIRNAEGKHLGLRATNRDITKQKQSEVALRWQNEYLAALQETTIDLLSVLNLDTLMENIVRRACLLFGTSSGYLDLVDSETGLLIPRIGLGVLTESLQHMVQPGEGVTGIVWQTGKPFVVNDYDNLSERIEGYTRGALSSIIGIPLLYRGQVLGVLGVGYDFATQKKFEQKDVEIITQFAQLAAIAIENARLFSVAQIELAEREQAELAMRLRSEELSTLLDALPVITWITLDPDCRVIVGNRAANDLTVPVAGAKDSQMDATVGQVVALRQFGKDGIELLPEERPMQRAIALAQPVHDVEIEFRLSDGRQIYVLGNAVPLFNEQDQVRGAVGAFVNITERLRQEAEILATQAELQRLLEQGDQSRLVLLSVVEDQKMAEEVIQLLNADLEQRVADRTVQLEASNKELEAFAYSVSHDLRAPLRAIDGFSRILEQEYSQKLDEEGLRLLGVVRNSTSRMDQLITDILALSRVGRSELRYSPIDMTTLVNSIYHEIATPAVLEKFEFKVSELPRASGDPTLMRQVWANLISNAIKYTLPKEKCVIEISGSYKDGLCTYIIKDNGVGFNPKYTDKLFGLFQRLHKASEFEGTGVGLAIVQRIIHRHGGEVWGEGQIGAGATFSFTIPERQVNHA